MKNAVQSELNLLEHEKAMDRLSAENELLWLERIYNSYEMSYEDRLSMEEKVHNARKAYETEIQKIQQETLDKKLEAIEKARSTSRITYEEELRQLREPYFRRDKSRHRKGNGLGLSIVTSILGMHGARFDMKMKNDVLTCRIKF